MKLFTAVPLEYKNFQILYLYLDFVGITVYAWRNQNLNIYKLISTL
jgi:hypothetical protein